MFIKNEVSLKGITPQIVVAMMVASSLFSVEYQVPLTVTSGSEGKHGYASLHFCGNAIDIRAKDLPSWISPERVHDDLKARLCHEFDVVLERDPLHIHIEWQPKD